MSGLAVADAADAAPAELRIRPLAWREPLVVAAIFVAASALYTLLGRGIGLPMISPDEFTYAALAKSVAAGHGLANHGLHEPWRAPLFTYLLAPSWVLSSGSAAYALAKATGAIAASLVVIPTWWLARDLLPPRLALAVAGLAVAGTWMAITPLLLTENLALPLAAASLAATALALTRSSERIGFAALALAALATFSRLQMGILFPIVLAAIGADLARRGRAGARAAFAETRVVTLVSAGIVLAGIVVLLVDPNALAGVYASSVHRHPSLGRILSLAGQHGIGLLALLAFVPAVVALAAATSKRCWRDETVGPLLAVALPAAALLCLEAGWFTAAIRLRWFDERYVEYVAPLTLVLAVAVIVRGMVPLRRAMAVTAGLALICLAAPPIRLGLEERATYITGHRLHQIAGLSLPVALAVACFGAGFAAIGLVQRFKASRALGAGAVAALVGALLLFQSQGVWQWQTRLAHQWRSAFPAQLAWIDRAAQGPVSAMSFSTNSFLFDETDFFNTVDHLYEPRQPVGGGVAHTRVCSYSFAAASGAVSFDSGCGRAPQRVWLDDPLARMTFADARVLGRQPLAGDVVALARGPVRLRAVMFPPCSPTLPHLNRSETAMVPAAKIAPCFGTFLGRIWEPRGGRLVLRFKGGAAFHYARVGTQVFAFPPRRVTTFALRVKPGSWDLQMSLDWRTTRAAPRLLSADLMTDGHDTPLL